ncbi:MAG: hypothetical protein AAF544_12770, partial [Bacteroidota bacterium]
MKSGEVIIWILLTLATTACRNPSETTSSSKSHSSDTTRSKGIHDTLFFMGNVPAEQLQDKLARDSKHLDFYLPFIDRSKI